MEKKRNFVGPIVLLVFLLILGFFGFSFYKTFTGNRDVGNQRMFISSEYKKFTALAPDYLTLVDGKIDASEEVSKFRKSLESLYEASYGGDVDYLHRKGVNAINNFKAIVEKADANEELAGSAEYSELKGQIFTIFDDIAVAEKQYNETAKAFNDKIDKFPRNLFAKFLGWGKFGIINFE